MIMGRDHSSTNRNGPRLIDLDILLYGTQEIYTSTLIIPHPQLDERDFVIGPLHDLCPNFVIPRLNVSVKEVYEKLCHCENIIPVVPIRSKGNEDDSTTLKFHPKSPALVMGIMNITPDSFSDGGDHFNIVNNSEERDKEINNLVSEIDRISKISDLKILDIGGESTRPGSKPLTADEEIIRVIPLIKAIRSNKSLSSLIISIDTYHSKTAEAAIDAGANIINDISGGTIDPDILKVALKYSVPIILMHIRGTPQSMLEHKHYNDENDASKLIRIVAEELNQRVDEALKLGI
eukprot:TRINITY_DN192_c0_g1_i16.p2 TRINITY_DN192_c0_g1~~TRINITY_DN192_c0_g1_i16.p2  ORF type:complete len:292 (+),score=31.27 TRINITY_DN192_c0_g1_i16:2288-3163(+)